MPKPLHSTWWGLSVAVLGLVILTAPAESQRAKDNLGGTWKFNAAKTAADQAALQGDPSVREGYLSGGRPRVGTGVTGGGDAGGGARPTGGGGGSRPNLGPLDMFARPLPELVIVQTDSSFTISDPRGTPRTYYADGRKEIEPLPSGESLEIVARWKGGKLTTERKLGSLGSVREVYWIDTGSQALVLEVRITGPGIPQPLQLRRTYDPVPGS